MARILKVRSSSLEGTRCHKYLGRLCICPCVRDTSAHNLLVPLCWSSLIALVWTYQAPSELSNVDTNSCALYSDISFTRYQLYLIQIRMKYFWQSNKNFLQRLPFYRFHNNFMKIQNVPVLPNLKFDQADPNCIRKYHVCNIRSKQEHVLFYIAFLQICKQWFMVSKTVFGPKLLSKNTKQVIAASQIFFFSSSQINILLIVERVICGSVCLFVFNLFNVQDVN